MMVSEPWVLVPALVLHSSLFLWWGWGGCGEDECVSREGIFGNLPSWLPRCMEDKDFMP